MYPQSPPCFYAGETLEKQFWHWPSATSPFPASAKARPSATGKTANAASRSCASSSIDTATSTVIDVEVDVVPRSGQTRSSSSSASWLMEQSPPKNIKPSPEYFNIYTDSSCMTDNNRSSIDATTTSSWWSPPKPLGARPSAFLDTSLLNGQSSGKPEHKAHLCYMSNAPSILRQRNMPGIGMHCNVEDDTQQRKPQPCNTSNTRGVLRQRSMPSIGVRSKAGADADRNSGKARMHSAERRLFMKVDPNQRVLNGPYQQPCLIGGCTRSFSPCPSMKDRPVFPSQRRA
eukprot:gnl/MRDRNA2_/MRDRNA2_200984_c0_seq1.p1 gnl/MRDRNA2_/MRDRNA2_200984_c0~~gnl/MRDRNA2_/MRDRNA2_200984_c0_seq1.p1  ORF type:complete len:321 (+),score=41.98 gnl/MRDRNA2_/MRDRNA2_200984_c0_seq1:102-965(+)